MHMPPLQTWFPVHPAPLDTHWCAVTSQHPPAHVLPLQHGWPMPPQVAHDPPLQTLPALHALPAQHG
jgi:hypothetical protein